MADILRSKIKPPAVAKLSAERFEAAKKVAAEQKAWASFDDPNHPIRVKNRDEALKAYLGTPEEQQAYKNKNLGAGLTRPTEIQLARQNVVYPVDILTGTNPALVREERREEFDKAIDVQIEKDNAIVIEKEKADQAAKDAKDKADQIAKDNARNAELAAQSAAASLIAAKNRGEVSDKLKQRLTTPMQQNAQVAPIPYVSGGYATAATKQSQVQPTGGASTSAPMESPGTAIAAKINSDAGGTNAAQNRYQMPNITGLTFGGT